MIGHLEYAIVLYILYRYWFSYAEAGILKENKANAIAADALAPCFIKASAILSM